MDRRLVALIVSAALLAVVVVVVLVARGGDDDGAPEISAELSEKPGVEVPEGPPPAELEIEDLVTGEGTEATAGSEVTVQYVLVDYESGEELEASWDQSEPFQFQLGAGNVIPGWDQGVEGMRVGGRRQLVIPPDLAYGRQGSPPAIGPNATLVFVVDLVSVG
jgi:peptidylprolyl isomerase